MCGRYTLTQPAKIFEELGIEDLPAPSELKPRYNIAPTQDAPVLRAGPSGGRELVLLRWGLIPFWAKEAAIGNRMINARAETVAEKPSFKTALVRRRCAVLADGFYEWKKVSSGKQPYLIHLPERRPFVMAGLWDRWTKGEEGPVESFTIITTAANATVSSLHDRMPVILSADAWPVWLDSSVNEPEMLVKLLRPDDDHTIELSPVSKLVNNPRHDAPACVETIAL